jgi:preprotein translocase subunit SecG
MLYSVLIVIHIIVSILLMASILVQSGKGGGLAAGLGGASATQDVFGSVGAQTFLKKSSVALGGLFMGISLVLALLATQTDSAMDVSQGDTRESSRAEPIVSEGGGSSSDEASGQKKEDTKQEGATTDQNQAEGSSAAETTDTEKSASGSAKPTSNNDDKSGESSGN